MPSKPRIALIVVITVLLGLYLVPRMVSKSTISRAEAFITGAPEAPRNVVKTGKVQESISREYPAVRAFVLDTQFRNEKTTEAPNGKGAQYEGTVTAEVQFPEGIAPECLPNNPQRPWGCQYVDVPPVPINGTIVLEGVLKLKRDIPNEPWTGGVPCCMKRVN